MAARTPSQTIGPFFHEALRWKDGGQVRFAEEGPRVVLVGRMVDGAGEPVADAMVETWQAAPGGGTPASGNEGNPHGFARVETGPDGGFRIETRMPGGPAPHLDVAIFARGLLKPLRTRVYLAPEPLVRADPVLAPLADSPRLATLLAQPAGAAGEYRWEVRLQGEGETVFFDA
jgi:protocatechuate 3,4-dioxygenase alpha subunit